MYFHINILILAKKEDWEDIIEYFSKDNKIAILKHKNKINIRNSFVDITIRSSITECLRGQHWDKVFYDPEIIDIYSEPFQTIIRPVVRSNQITSFKLIF